ncbi:MAG: ABC transporter substrate-binding protein [Actinomycetota bacterium]
MPMRSRGSGSPSAGRWMAPPDGTAGRRRGPLEVWLFDHQVTLLAGALAIALVAGLVAATRHTGPISSAAGPAASLSPTEQLAGGQGPAGPSGSPSDAGGTAGGTSSISKRPTAGSGTGKTSEFGTLTASDRGVTKDSVTLGWLAPSVANMHYGATLGIPVLSYPAQDFIDPFAKEINGAGGINGRSLNARAVEYDMLSQDDWTAKCVAVAEDLKAFGAITFAGYYGDAEVCLADKQIATVAFNTSSDATRAREKGWVRETRMGKDRLVKNWADWAIAGGVIKPSSRVGVVWVDNPEDTPLVSNVALAYLKSKGVNVVEKFQFSSDYSKTPTESASAVLRFKQSRVDVVWCNYDWFVNSFFLNQAESQNYRPKYSASDMGDISNDITTQNYNANQWDRVRALTVLRVGEIAAGKPLTPGQKQCQDAYAKFGGKAFKTNSDRDFMMYVCEHIWLWAKAARLAGPDLTRVKFLAAIDSLGTYNERVATTDTLVFKKGRYTAADNWAVIEWRKECKCYWQVEGFRKGTW